MEFDPYDRVSQVFRHEWHRDNTISTPCGDVVHLDLRHLGRKELLERLPFVCKLVKTHVGIDSAREPVPVRPTVYYTMDGIETDQRCGTRIKGPFVTGEYSSVGLHGTSRLDSNSPVELVILGRIAGEQTAKHVITVGAADSAVLDAQVTGTEERLKDPVNQEDNENWFKTRDEMGLSIEEGCGTYHTPELMQKTIDKLAELQGRFKRVRTTDTSSVFGIDLLYTIELGHGLNVIECVTHPALVHKGSCGAHQRLGEDCIERDDVNPPKYTLAFRDADGVTCPEYSDVRITTLPPVRRVYGGEAGAVGKKEKVNG